MSNDIRKHKQLVTNDLITIDKPVYDVELIHAVLKIASKLNIHYSKITKIFTRNIISISLQWVVVRQHYVALLFIVKLT